MDDLGTEIPSKQILHTVCNEGSAIFHDPKCTDRCGKQQPLCHSCHHLYGDLFLELLVGGSSRNRGNVLRKRRIPGIGFADKVEQIFLCSDSRGIELANDLSCTVQHLHILYTRLFKNRIIQDISLPAVKPSDGKIQVDPSSCLMQYPEVHASTSPRLTPRWCLLLRIPDPASRNTSRSAPWHLP